ncbi:hypothetical protein FE257_004465 [Aspergillus nanangensis]|uniref:Uncharacterized protein n=1 Tax=Aspergillus nanangensis TaxID=2582783 RepID=A0AAD4CY27_ASPNN|nr:hypothetical protein FE257_004465 [Aspergillus nanangensis]
MTYDQDGQAGPEQTGTPPSKKRIFLNGFDMFTVGHLSFGQWRHPSDRASTKRRDLSYWTDLAQLLEKGDFNALFLADSYGLHDTYQGSGDAAIRNGSQFPMGDPSIPISAMASVTKNLGFAITTSTSYEAPYVVAKRFSTLDHLTGGRFGWNIVTSWKASASKAVGLPLVEHDKRYEIADEYLRVLYKLWEGSWADDALQENTEAGVYTDPQKVKFVHHQGDHFAVNGPHILDPSPQRTPFLFQAGTSSAGIGFGGRHAEGIFVSAPSPHILAPRVKVIRDEAAKAGRDPRSIKVFAIFTPILGNTDEEANAKYQDALNLASVEGGLAFFSSNIGIDLSKFDLDTEIQPGDIHVDARVHSSINTLSYHGADVPKWTPRNIGKLISLGGNGPVVVGSPEKVADIMEDWIRVADLDGFNIGLGKNGPELPHLGLGLMGLSAFYGEKKPDSERFAFLDAAYQLGETFWDSADVYGDNEDLLGKWFQSNPDKRKDIFLATKFANRKNDDGSRRVDSSPEYVHEACQLSLSRLGIETIDLYYCHRLDRKTPIEKTVEAMAQLKTEGKIKYLGLSECSADSLRRAHKVHPITAVQMEYSPFALEIESPQYRLLETARELGVAVVAYSPLGRGFMTGEITSADDIAEGDFRKFAPRFSEENFPKNLALIEVIKTLAGKKNATPAQLTLAWLMAQGQDIFPIPGTTRVSRLQENLGSLSISLTPQEEKEFRSACAAVEIAGSRYPEAFSAALFADTPPL